MVRVFDTLAGLPESFAEQGTEELSEQGQSFAQLLIESIEAVTVQAQHTEELTVR